ncbi:phage integrase SAM-like domain-containing protein [Phocaeicola plebeius]|uniref:phage integrase SAM-like domain-containing protein n=1 Tax=Phocaeicola plebeius TaxID=310297 RepID=UPI003FEE729D
MATLSLTLFKAKVLKDGSHKIRIAVRHKHETCYIITRFIVEENQFKNGQVVKRPDAAFINTKLRLMMNEYQERLDRISNQNLYTCRQLKDILMNSAVAKESSTFQDVCRKYISELEEEGRKSYASLLERNNRYFTEFTKGDILLSDITPVLIEGYSRFLKVKKGVGDTTLGMMMSRTRTIINRGIKRQLVKYDVHPFLNYSISASKVREVDLSIETFNKIRLAHPDERKLRVAHDLFCLSFYLGGINLIDLLQVNFKGTDTLEYVRVKTRNTVVGTRTISFSIPEPAKVIIDRWMNRNTGRLDFGYKFSYPNFSRYITRSLTTLSKNLGITEKVVYYSARKSFAQYASEIGIPDGIIDYCLGHSDKSKGVIRYYTKVRQKQADMAISRVIDYVDNPEKYKEYIELRSDIMMMRG